MAGRRPLERFALGMPVRGWGLPRLNAIHDAQAGSTFLKTTVVVVRRPR